jgi:hypothetical protein
VHFLLEQCARALEGDDPRRAGREVGLQGLVRRAERFGLGLQPLAAPVGTAQARIDGAEEEREEQGGGEEDRRQRSQPTRSSFISEA